MKRSLLALACLLLWAQPASATYTFLVATAKANNSGSITTSAIDTTGADLIVCAVTDDDRDTAASLSDSQSNSWTTGPPSKYNSSDFASMRLYYKQSPSTSASHTFSITFPNVGGVACAAYSGSVASPLDTPENGNTTAFGGGATIATGSVTPTADNYILITGLAFYLADATPTIDLSFTRRADDHSSGNMGVAIADLIETTAAAKNPTWTAHDVSAGSRGMAASIAVFKVAGGGSPPASTPSSGGLMTLGVGMSILLGIWTLSGFALRDHYKRDTQQQQVQARAELEYLRAEVDPVFRASLIDRYRK